MRLPHYKHSTWLCLLLACLAGRAAGETPTLKVVYDQGSGPVTIVGRRIAHDQQGGVCLQDDTGSMWLLEAPEVVANSPAGVRFQPATHDQLAKRLQQELGDHFRTHTTPHYVVVHSTSREFARWLSSMLERLHRAFVNYWSRRGLELSEPEFPLVVIVYRNQAEFRQAAAKTPGAAGQGVVGYYDLQSNRVSMYDLTGTETLKAHASGRSSLREINQMLRSPAAVPLVTTIVHEATHQVAFNTGMNQRLASLPVWYLEGMAIYFEAPDLSSSRRWSGIGRVNPPRMAQFRQGLPDWTPDRLRQLLQQDKLFRNPQTASQAYADAWALSYYLIRFDEGNYTAYAKELADLPPFEAVSPNDRLAMFERHFGPLEPLTTKMLKSLARIR